MMGNGRTGVRAAGLGCLLMLSSAASAYAAPADLHANASARTVALTFRLQVTGTPDARTTFWVAYGPVRGRFGVIRLHKTGSPGVYSAQWSVAPNTHTTLAYLAGQGTVRTPAGQEPGDPVVVIKRIAPMVARPGTALPQARWTAPVG